LINYAHTAATDLADDFVFAEFSDHD
jgi:hypothetical protein